MKKLLLGLLALGSLVLSGSAIAQSPTTSSPYCGTNSDSQTLCFNTRSEAEDFIRADPNGTHPARKYLEFNSHSLDRFSTLPYESYSVRPSAGSESAPGYKAEDNGASTAYVQVACDVTGTTGLLQHFGSVSNCSNQPNLCTYGYYCNTKGTVLTAISEGVKQPNCAAGSAWESVAPPARPLVSNNAPPDNKPNYPPNTGSFFYHGFYQGEWLGGSIDFQYPTGTDCAGLGGGRLIERVATAVTCPAGYAFSSDTPPNESNACKSSEWGYLRVYYSPASENTPCPDGTCGKYGDPILPATGATIQTPAGWDLGSMLGVNLTYNSATTDKTTGIFGGGWNSMLQTHYAGTDSSHRDYSFVGDDGNVEVYYTPAGIGPLRPLGAAGKVFWSSVANGCEYILYEANRRVILACTQLYYGHILRVEYPDAPEKNLTFNWSNSDGVGVIGNATLVNTINSVTRTDGRRLDLHYGTINTSPNCLTTAFAFACNVKRLIAITDSDSNLTAFSYNAEGRLERITYPEGNRERFEYGNAADVCPASMPNACDGTPNARMMRALLTGTYIETLQGDGSYVSVRRGTYQFDNRGRAIRTSLPDDAMRVEVSYAANGTPTVKRFVDTTHFTKREIVPTQVSMWQKPGVITDTDSTGAVVRSMRAEYDASGYLSKTVDFKGNETLWTYSIDSLPTQRVEANNDLSNRRTTQWDWDPSQRMMLEARVYNSSAALLPGTLVARTRYAFNPRGQHSAVCSLDPANATAMAYICGSAANAPNGVRQTRFTYCESSDVTAGTCPIIGQPLSIDGPRTDIADATSFSYYQLDSAGCAPAIPCDYHKGDLRQVTNALGHGVQFLRYDGAGRVKSSRSPTGVVTDLDYWARGWLKWTKRRGADDSIEADDAITRFTYNAIGQVIGVTAEDGVTATFLYDDAGRVKSVVDASGSRRDISLDMSANPVAESTRDQLGNVKQSLSRVFNDLDQLRSEIDANNVATQLTYDPNGNLDVLTDPLNRTSDSDTDSLSRVIKTIANTTGPANEKATTLFRYDARDYLTSVVDPKGLTTSYTFNGLGDMTQLQSPDTGTTTRSYNAGGLLSSQNDARGVLTGFSYDALGRLTSKIVPTTAQNMYFDYDTPQSDCGAGETFGTGTLSRIRDESGSTRYCYDRFGRLVRKAQSVTSGSTLVVDWTYNAAGRLVAMTYPSGAIVVYHRDAQGRIDDVAAVPAVGQGQATLVSAVKYLPFGPLSSLTLGSGTLARVQTRAYDGNYGIDKVSDSAASNPFSEDYTLDNAGHVTQVVERTGVSTVVTKDFSYDGLDRLKLHKNGATTVEGFAYDATGNRVSKTAGSTTTYTYPSTSHKLSAVGSIARSYDNAGNTTAIDTSSRGSGFSYDDNGRMRDFMLARRLKTSYRYNGRGERVLKTNAVTASLSRQFVYDDAGHLLGEYTTAGARVKEYVWLDDTLVAVLGSFPGKAYRLVETDSLGTPRAVINPDTGIIEWRWDLNPTAFGEHAPNSNPDGDATIFELNIRYPGQHYDAESGLNYNYFRDYDPATGRYIQSDPIGLNGGISTYAYVGDNPLQHLDPLGLTIWRGQFTYGVISTPLPSWLGKVISGPSVGRLQLTLKGSCIDGRSELVRLIGYEHEWFGLNLPNDAFAGEIVMDDHLEVVSTSALGGSLSMTASGSGSRVSGTITAGKATGTFSATGLDLLPVEFSSTSKVERLIPCSCAK